MEEVLGKCAPNIIETSTRVESWTVGSWPPNTGPIPIDGHFKHAYRKLHFCEMIWIVFLVISHRVVRRSNKYTTE